LFYQQAYSNDDKRLDVGHHRHLLFLDRRQLLLPSSTLQMEYVDILPKYYRFDDMFGFCDSLDRVHSYTLNHAELLGRLRRLVHDSASDLSAALVNPETCFDRLGC
jgi:hypothetical protein